MKITRDYRRGNLGISITAQSLDGVTHSQMAEQEAVVGKMFDKIRKIVTTTLIELEQTDGQIPLLQPEGR